MGNPNGFRTVLLIAPPMFLVFPIAAITFILDRVSQALLYAQSERSWRSGTREITLYGPSTDNSTEYNYTDVSMLTDSAPTFAIICVCLGACFVALVGTCAVWELRRIEGTASHQRKWCWLTIFVNIALAGASFGVLAWLSSRQGSNRGWASYEDVGRSGARYTKEQWACQIDKFYPKQDWAGHACGIAKAARFMLIPLGISALLVILCIFILARDRGGFKWLGGGKGRYGGFENIYEMQPPPHRGPIVLQPMPQSVPQHMPQWIPQPMPQTILHPALQPKQQPPPQTNNSHVTYQGPVAYR